MNCGFRIHFKDRTEYIALTELPREDAEYRTTVGDASIIWRRTAYRGGYLADMEVISDKPLGIKRIDSIVYNAGVPEITDRISVIGRSATNNEIRFPHEFGAETEYRETASGLFKHLDGKGLILAGVSPFENICQTVTYKNSDGSFTFSVSTEYTESMQNSTSLKTERIHKHKYDHR